MRTLHTMKLSAIHNLRIQKADLGKKEGLILPRSIMRASDLQEYEQVIVTKINGKSFDNRIRTIVLTDDCDMVTVCGSLARFLSAGDLTCVISETAITEEKQNSFVQDKWPIFDVGFNPETNTDNSKWIRELQYCNKKIVADESYNIENALASRRELLRVKMASLVVGMEINKTHPDCLHGSAEIPASVLKVAEISQYRSVSVYNATIGGVAETYAVAMPEGTVMTTGAMASFAKLGDLVNVAAFDITNRFIKPVICYTDGVSVKEVAHEL